MELVNAIYKYLRTGRARRRLCKRMYRPQAHIALLAPFAPHFAEEMWETLGGEYSVFNQPFPTADEAALKKSHREHGPAN